MSDNVHNEIWRMYSMGMYVHQIVSELADQGYDTNKYDYFYVGTYLTKEGEIDVK